jgi:hypothetical protein
MEGQMASGRVLEALEYEEESWQALPTFPDSQEADFT